MFTVRIIHDQAYYWTTAYSARSVFLFGLGFLLSTGIDAQESSSRKDDQITITITESRLAPSVDQVPAAISVVEKNRIQRGTQQLGLDESLASVPGLFMQNRYNFAQDLRISIRGFGARASFGIRGIKILVDGVPETLPDGQSQVDSIDLGSAQQIDVIRGPVSSLWGNASGGVISITTEDGPVRQFLEGTTAVGEFGYRKYQLKAGGEQGRVNHLVTMSRLELDGYRDHSQVENNLFNSKFRISLNERSNLLTLINLVDSPIANDPGSLTREQAKADPKHANPRNVLFDAGEEVDQQKLGFVYDNAFDSKNKLTIRNYYVWRDFANKLPFQDGGAVDLDRFLWGGGALYIREDSVKEKHFRLIAGIDLDRQNDNRKRFDNNQGDLGDLVFDQKENVTSVGLFFRGAFDVVDKLELFLGGRYDWIRFDIDDEFLGDGDDSGDRTFEELSPTVGLLFGLSPNADLYANISTSFQTPTTAELANPSGQGGLNPDLEAETATNYEVGVKGVVLGLLDYEVALFHVDVENELVPFEVAAQPGRTFFRNAGQSRRDGVEINVSAQLSRDLTASLSYTYSNFIFDSFSDEQGNVYDGNRIPGIPEHLAQASLSYEKSGIFSEWEILHVGEFFVNNANTEKNDAYLVSNLKGGYSASVNGWGWTWYLGVNNLFNEHYNSNVRINAFGGRYFEPAPERNVYAGVNLRYSFDN